MARLEAAVHLLDEVLRLGDLERVPQLVVGGVLVPEAQVARHGPREQERLLRDDADPLPQVLEAHLADVDTIDLDRAGRGVVEARDQVDQRRLAAAGAADDRGRLAGTGAERDVPKDGFLGAGIAELEAAEDDLAAAGRIARADRLLRIADHRLRVEHLADPPRRDDAARDQDEHEDRGQDGEQDLGEVLHVGGQAADRQRPLVDADGAEPDDGHRGQVEDGRDRRDREREQAGDPQRGVEQVATRRVEALLPRAACERRPG